MEYASELKYSEHTGQHISECCLVIVFYCSMGDHNGVLLTVISVLMNYFTWYFYRNNNVNILRCCHIESDLHAAPLFSACLCG